MKLKTIKQTVIFKHVIPQQLYDALMTSKQHAQFTGEKAKISTKVGGKFTAYADYISGKNLELVPGKTIVQLWRGSDWPAGEYSTVTFSFKKLTTGTQLTFVQKEVPVNFYADIKQGWKDFYWQPLKEFFK